jgi:hypothetical protein
MKALNRSLKLISVASLAVLITAIGCSDSDKGDDDDSSAAGADSSAGTAGKSSTAGSAGTTTTEGGTDGNGDGQGGAKSDAGSPSQAGTSAAQGGEGGEASGGSPGLVLGHGGDNGAGGAPETGPTVAKFCNDLSFDDDDDDTTPNVDTTMVLTVGEGADMVTFEATTGECVPVACKEVPTGDDVLVQMYDADDTNNALDAGTINIPTGGDWIFYADLFDFPDDNVNGRVPVWNYKTVQSDTYTCADITYDDIYNP